MGLVIYDSDYEYLKIFLRQGKLILCYDAGQVVEELMEVEITEDEAKEVQASNEGADRVIRSLQNSRRPHTRKN
jgi:hypothetical protein